MREGYEKTYPFLLRIAQSGRNAISRESITHRGVGGVSDLDLDYSRPCGAHFLQEL